MTAFANEILPRKKLLVDPSWLTSQRFPWFFKCLPEFLRSFRFQGSGAWRIVATGCGRNPAGFGRVHSVFSCWSMFMSRFFFLGRTCWATPLTKVAPLMFPRKKRMPDPSVSSLFIDCVFLTSSRSRGLAARCLLPTRSCPKRNLCWIPAGCYFVDFPSLAPGVRNAAGILVFPFDGAAFGHRGHELAPISFFKSQLVFWLF